MCKNLACFCILIFFVTPSAGQPLQPELLQKQWPAFWIASADAAPNAYSVQYFTEGFYINRKTC